MDTTPYTPLDLKTIKDNKHTHVSTEEALKDVIPIKWDDEVISGHKSILLVDNK